LLLVLEAVEPQISMTFDLFLASLTQRNGGLVEEGGRDEAEEAWRQEI
jgi:hypothetical protein